MSDPAPGGPPQVVARDEDGRAALSVTLPDRVAGAGRTSITVVVAGDVMCPDHAELDAGRPPWRSLSGVLGAADLSIADLEAPISSASPPRRKSGPSLRSHPATAAALRAGGFTAVSLANNHIRDCGASGVLDTLEACERAGLRVVGAGPDLAGARAPLLLDIGGVKLGVAAVAEREFSIAGESLPGAAPLLPYTTPADILGLREAVDVLLVLVHGGNELHRLPSPRLAALARALARCGADAVVFQHQHVHSGIEVVGRSIVCYGTGNFFFPWRSRHPSWSTGYLVRLRLGKDGPHECTLLPHRQSEGQVTPLPATEAASFGDDLAQLCRTIASPRLLQDQWRRFCERNRLSYFSRLLGLTRVEQAALKRGVWPWWRLPRSRLRATLNLLRCEAHHDVMVTLLEEEIERTEARHDRERG
jgi:poly-gamma-glutamate synthesis protein (capsule biosynthesis protein)